MKRLLASVLSLLLLPGLALAQLISPVYSMPSPEVGTLGTFEEIGVDHFTGLPQVGVPIHEIEAGDYRFRISLGYDLASVKPHLQHGAVGIGWQLLADACISRTVRGVYDEKMDSEGVRYEFGGVDAIDFSIPYYNRCDGDLVATGWHLKKITTPQGRTIRFEYRSDELLCDLNYTSGSYTCYGIQSSSYEYLHQERKDN